MTQFLRKWTWLAAMLATVLAWSVPAEAGPRGKKDEALQKRLHASGGAGEYRVIVETVAGPAAPAILASGGKAGRSLTSFRGQVAMVNARQLARLERHPLVKAIYLDRETRATMGRVSLSTGARSAQFFGYDGAGVGVAVIDSGITSWHDDLTYQGTKSYVPVVGGQRVARFKDFVNGRWSAYDDHGHGTHVAGIIAGNGYDSLGFRAGVAPAAHLVALKVLDANANGYISDVIAAIDYALDKQTQYNIRVINLSVGAPVTQSYWTDPLALSTKRAVEAGIVVVAAAGNRGRDTNGAAQYGAINAPGNAPWVLTVGAYSDQGTLWRWDDEMAPYSSRGPTAYDFLSKPDLAAPGTGIVSLATPNSTLYNTRSSYLVGGLRPTSYTPYLSLTGTSMAAPVVSGTVALMLQANPALTPNAVKAILQFTAQADPGTSSLEQGAGFLNTFGAVTLASHWASHPRGTRYPTSPSWSKQIIWGNHRLTGGVILPGATAWAANIVWGTVVDREGDNIVWGTLCPSGDCDNIVWGTGIALDALDNIVWGTLAGDDNIVWGTFRSDVDNIVWGTAFREDDNIVWGTLFGDDNIVWGTDCGGNDCDNVVWGTVAGGDNIVWGTAESLDNIVWGTAGEVDNIVWGTACSAADCDNIVWGTAASGDNIVWGTDAGDPLVIGESPLWDDLVDPATVDFESLFEPVSGSETDGLSEGGTL